VCLTSERILQVNYSLTLEQLSTLPQLYVPNVQDSGCIDLKSHDSVVLTLAGKAKELALTVHGSELEIKRQLELNKAEAQKTCYTSRESKKPYILRKWSSENNAGFNQGSVGKTPQEHYILIAPSLLTNCSRWCSVTISFSSSENNKNTQIV
jgi:hypothetical protein